MTDEEERIISIVEHIEREHKEVVLVEMEGVDSDKNEGDAVLAEWS
jgi:hypothetical protein